LAAFVHFTASAANSREVLFCDYDPPFRPLGATSGNEIGYHLTGIFPAIIPEVESRRLKVERLNRQKTRWRRVSESQLSTVNF
jgi:hypothetical protein